MIGQIILLASALSVGAIDSGATNAVLNTIDTNLSLGNAEFDRTAAEGAAKIAARRAAMELAQKGPGEGLLKKAMLASPNDFVTRAEAEKKCREIFAAESKKAFEAQCVEIRKRLELPNDFKIEWTDGDAKKVNGIFPRIFNAERSDAITEQAKTIVGNIRPSETEFETIPENKLRAKIVEQVFNGQKTAVFDENKKYISDQIVTPMIAGGHAERRRQREYLMRARCESISPTKLANELKARLNENVAATRAKEKDVTKAWGVFPSVINGALPGVVERRSLDRFLAKIETATVKVEVPELETLISKDPASHVKVRDSEQKLAAHFGHDILSTAFADAMKDVPQEDKEELKKFFTDRMVRDEVKKSVERVVRREVMPKWRIARDSVSQKQLQQFWPTFANDTWFPGAELADETAARSDYADAVRNWRTKVEALKAMANAGNGKSVFEEVNGKVDMKVVREFDRARGAIAKQNTILDKVGKDALASYKAQKAQPAFPDIVTKLTDETMAKWVEERVATLWPDGKIPPNAEEQHPELFPSVKKKIDVIAKAILHELSVKSQSDSTATDSADSEEDETFSVSVMRMGSRVSLTLMQGKAPVYSKTVNAKMSDFKAAMQEFAEKIGRDYINVR